MNWTKDDYLLTDDPKAADPAAIHAMLRTTYWAAERTREQIERSLQHSLCLSLLHHGKQVGLARAVTDYGAYTWLCDVLVHESHRGKGLGKWLMECMVNHPDLASTRFILTTKDAQALYRQCGFETHPFECMIKWEPKRGSSSI